MLSPFWGGDRFLRFYGNQFGSSYEELISYYPRYYRDL